MADAILAQEALNLFEKGTEGARVQNRHFRNVQAISFKKVLFMLILIE
jgi:hypothetical protein